MGQDRTELVAVVAMAENGVIGRAGALPWRLPDDLKRFKSITMGRPIVMGRRTFETLAQALPGRQNIVVTRNAGWSAPGVTVARSLVGALSAAGAAPEVMVIGGADLYRQFWPQVARVELTLVHARPAGDVLLEGFDWREWQVLTEQRHEADAHHAHAFTFMTLQRTPQA